FKKVAQEVSGRNLDSVFKLLDQKGSLQKAQKKSLKVSFMANFKNTDKYNYLLLAPAAGYNLYDKFMIGGIIHNYTLPPTRFQFFVIPLYATGSKQLNGIGKLSYSFYPGKNGQKFQAAISGSRF